MRRQRARVKVSDVRVVQIREWAAAHGGADWLLSSRAAEVVRAAQSVPTVTRQVLVLWAQRYGVEGESWRYQEGVRWRLTVKPIEISLVWLARFLERTGRAAHV